MRELLERLDCADSLLIYGDRLEEYLADGAIDETEWKSLQPELNREHERQGFLEQKRKIQDAIRRKLLSDFVRDAPTKYDFQKPMLKSRIETLLWEGKRDDLQAYLTDVLELGLENADKKLKREKRKGGYFLYAWVVFVGIVKVGIVLGAFSVSKNKFETVVIALLILTYQMTERNFGDLLMFRLLSMDESRIASKRIRRLLKEEKPEEVAEGELEEERTLEKTSRLTAVANLIQGVFSLIIFAITLFELVFEGIF